MIASVLAALAAVTVTTAMRVVGLLLVSALMIVPVAAAQVFARSFASTMAIASSIGVYALAAVAAHFIKRPAHQDDPHPMLHDDVHVEPKRP